MAELNLKQIADKLNSEFAGEGRKLIFGMMLMAILQKMLIRWN